MWLSAPCWWCCALQEAATRSEAVSLEARRRSFSWTGVASWETPRGTPAATRVTRTWRTVMTAWVACELCPPPLLPHPSLEILVWSSVLLDARAFQATKFSFHALLERLCCRHIYFWCSVLFPSIFSFKSYFLLFLHHWIKLFCSHFFVCSVLLRIDITCLSLQALHSQYNIQNGDNTKVLLLWD